MANIFQVSHILPDKLAKYEKLGKYWSYCTRNRAITNAYFQKKVRIKINPIQNIFKLMFVYYYKCYISTKLTFLKELMLIK